MSRRNRERRVSRLMKLNKDIHNTAAQIDNMQRDVGVLQLLVEEFSQLVFDKLALDSIYQQDFSSDLDLQTLRVILGRTKIAMRYFNEFNAPLSSESKSNFKKRGSGVISEPKYTLYFSRKTAEKRLCKLTDQFVELQRKYDGLTNVIRRFEEDNKALKVDIKALRDSPGVNYDANFGQHTWTRLAGVDLMTTAEKRQSVISQRRASSLNMRRMSVTSTKSHSTDNINSTTHHQPNTYPINLFEPPVPTHHSNMSTSSLPQTNAFNSFPQYQNRRSSMHANMDHRLSMGARRRSGALSDTDLSLNDSVTSTNTTVSANSFTKTQPMTSAHLGQWRRSGIYNVEI